MMMLWIGVGLAVFGLPATPWVLRRIREARAERARRAEEAQQLATEARVTETARLLGRAVVTAERLWLQFAGTRRQEIIDDIEAAHRIRVDADNAAAEAKRNHAAAVGALAGWLSTTKGQVTVLVFAFCAIPVCIGLTNLDYDIFRHAVKLSTAIWLAPFITILVAAAGLLFGWAVGWHGHEHWPATDRSRYQRGVYAMLAVAITACSLVWLHGIAPKRSQEKADAVTSAQQAFDKAKQQNDEATARGVKVPNSDAVLNDYLDAVSQAETDRNSAKAFDQGSVLVGSALELICVESAMLAVPVLVARRRGWQVKRADEAALDAREALNDCIAERTVADRQAVEAIFSHLEATTAHPDPAQPVAQGTRNAWELWLAIARQLGVPPRDDPEYGDTQATGGDGADQPDPATTDTNSDPGRGGRTSGRRPPFRFHRGNARGGGPETNGGSTSTNNDTNAGGTDTTDTNTDDTNGGSSQASPPANVGSRF